MTRLKSIILGTGVLAFVGLGALMFSEGLNPKIVPIIKPSYFQTYEEIGQWTYSQLRPKMFQESAISFGLNPKSADQGKIFFGFRQSAIEDQRPLQAFEQVPEENSHYLHTSEIHKLETSQKKSIVSMTVIEWPKDEAKSQELYKSCEELPEPAETRTVKSLYCLMAKHSREFDRGKVKGSGPIKASVALIGERDYLILLK